MAQLAVTGAAGYIGNLLSRTAATEGWDVRGVDDLTGPISIAPDGIRFLSERFFSPEALRFLEGSEVVLHLAAVSGVMPCANDPVGTREVNVGGTAQLVEWCRARRIPLAFASSLSVVGAPPQMPITETTPANPTHEYARQKAEGERLVSSLRPSGIAGVSVRMSNVYGSYSVSGRTVAKGNVINEFSRQAATGRLRVNSPGTQRRDFIHIADVVKAWLAVADRLRRGAAPNDVYLFASGTAASIREVAARMEAAWRHAHPRRAPLAVDVVENPRGAVELLDERFQVDPRATWESLGMRPSHELDREISRIVADVIPPS